jgi:hypothetical protein
VNMAQTATSVGFSHSANFHIGAVSTNKQSHTEMRKG